MGAENYPTRAEVIEMALDDYKMGVYENRLPPRGERAHQTAIVKLAREYADPDKNLALDIIEAITAHNEVVDTVAKIVAIAERQGANGAFCVMADKELADKVAGIMPVLHPQVRYHIHLSGKPMDQQRVQQLAQIDKLAERKRAEPDGRPIFILATDEDDFAMCRAYMAWRHEDVPFKGGVVTRTELEALLKKSQGDADFETMAARVLDAVCKDEDLPPVALKPAQQPFKRCHERGCDALVTEYRWSPYFCPTCDIARMKRIDKSLAAIEARFNAHEEAAGE